ncbi:MAG TPA: hypothetical protein PK231_04895 [Acidocella sp.]|nr:MAG: hypothetical protein B7Z77_06235 [Acidocella sp. 20-58-15]HQT38742.1 hypothetical protein [Acidocella sp.]
MSQVIKEAVAVFDTPETLEAAVFELETRGFDRAAFSLLASEAAVTQKLGVGYDQISQVEDNPAVPRETFFSHVSRLEAELLPAPSLAAIGVLMLFGVGGALPAMIAAGGGALIGAGLGRAIHQHNVTRVKEQLARGGLLLWVNLRDTAEEAKALAILKAHSAHDVHVHEMAA